MEDARLDSLTEDTKIHFEMGFYNYKQLELRCLQKITKLDVVWCGGQPEAINVCVNQSFGKITKVRVDYRSCGMGLYNCDEISKKFACIYTLLGTRTAGLSRKL